MRGRCRPLSLALSAGQVHDSDEATIGAVLDGVRVPRPGGKGRPRKRPERVLGDKGYSYKKCRRLLRQRGIACMIPERKDQREQRTKKGKAGGRPCYFDKQQGDGIIGIVGALVEAGWRPPLRSVCVLAQGQIWQDLRPLFGRGYAFLAAGVRLFEPWLTLERGTNPVAPDPCFVAQQPAAVGPDKAADPGCRGTSACIRNP
jgi:hypothetical protein